MHAVILRSFLCRKVLIRCESFYVAESDFTLQYCTVYSVRAFPFALKKNENKPYDTSM